MSKDTRDSSKKQAFEGATRVNAFRISPEQLVSQLVVVGRDTNHKAGEHPLWQLNATKPARRDIVNSMKTLGWKGGVIIVRKDGPDRYLVVDGRKRTVGARLANEELEAEGSEMRVCPLVIVERAEDADIATTMVVSNQMRVADNLLEKGRMALQLLNQGKAMPEVAAAFGVTTNAIEQWLKIPTECDAKIIEAIEQDRVAPSVALELAALPRDEQLALFAKLEAEGRLSVAAAKKEVSSTRRSVGEERARKIPVSAIRKLCKLAEKDEDRFGKFGLDPIVMAILRCVAGVSNVRTVKGLSAALREVGYGE